MSVHWVVGSIFAVAGVLIVATALALVGVVIGWLPLVILLAVLCGVWLTLWSLTRHSQRTFWREHRAWLDERRNKAVREEAQRIAKEETDHVRSIMWWMFGAR